MSQKGKLDEIRQGREALRLPLARLTEDIHRPEALSAERLSRLAPETPVPSVPVWSRYARPAAVCVCCAAVVCGAFFALSRFSWRNGSMADGGVSSSAAPMEMEAGVAEDEMAAEPEEVPQLAAAAPAAGIPELASAESAPLLKSSTADSLEAAFQEEVPAVSSYEELQTAVAAFQPEEPVAMLRSADLSGMSTGRPYTAEPQNVPDLLKIEGGTIYAVARATEYRQESALYLVQSGSLDLLSKIPISSGYTGEILVSGDRVAVIAEDMGVFSESSVSTSVKIYDVSDKTNPVLKREFHQEGTYKDAYQNGDEILLVTSSGAANPNQRADAEALAPRISDSPSGQAEPVPYGSIYLSDSSESPVYGVVSAVSFSEASDAASCAVLGASGEAFLSGNQVYLVSPGQDRTEITRLTLQSGTLSPTGRYTLPGTGTVFLGEPSGTFCAVLSSPEENALFQLSGETGQLREFAPGESLTAVTFTGSSVYAAAAGGSLWRIDLSGETPVLSGPQESAGTVYAIAPYGDGKLLTLEQASQDLRLALRDASTMTELSNVTIRGEGIWSEAINDPMALRIGENGTVSFPVQFSGDQPFSEIVLCKIQGDSMILAGEFRSSAPENYQYSKDYLLRGVLVNGEAYALSSGGLMVFHPVTLQLKNAAALN